MQVAVIGASGIIGRAMLDHLARAGIDAIGYSRRAPDLPGARHIPLDLRDPEACATVAAGPLSDATHLVYAALYEEPGLIAGWFAETQMQTNLTMLTNLVDPLLEGENRLRHLTLLQGTKAYGAHVHPMRLPGKEHEPRDPHPNFYWLQEDAVKERSAGAGWDYTIWRPQIVLGHGLRAPMNMIAALAAWGAICRERGTPLHYPGGPAGVTEATDADLLAQAMTFAFDNPDFAGETFNVTNGDVFTWEHAWPAIAAALHMPAGEPIPQLLAADTDAATTWNQVVERHGLRPLSLTGFIGDSFHYADALFNTRGTAAPPATLLSTIKLREAGFGACLDTESTFTRWFDELRQCHLLPPDSR